MSICKGCKTFEENKPSYAQDLRCKLEPINDKGITCPCVECVIKMICNRICDKYSVYVGCTTYKKPRDTGDTL